MKMSFAENGIIPFIRAYDCTIYLCTVPNLNLSLQEALNPAEHDIFMRGIGKVTMPKECLRRSGFAYRADDKVMQIKNNYDKEVFNGDIGRIESVNETDRTLTVDFDGRSIEYDAT